MASAEEREWREGGGGRASFHLHHLLSPLRRFRTAKNGQYKGLERARNGVRCLGHTSPEPLCAPVACAGHPEVEGGEGERCGRGLGR